MSINPTPTPTLYCSGYDSITVLSDDVNHAHLIGQYDIVHKSSIGIKYENSLTGAKITYSTKINNILNGHWRWSKDSPPYTLYYASSSTDACVPTTGWYNLFNSEFTGSITSLNVSIEYDIYQKCSIPTAEYDIYKRCDFIITPTPTPTITPVPTPSPTPVIHLPITDTFSPPPGIIRNELTERVWVKAKPTISYSDKLNVYPGKQNTITLYGLSFNYTSMVYLSGSSISNHPDNISVDIFSGIPSLSADFPGFFGMPITYYIIDENIVTVNIPEAVAPGEVDIIILNAAGYESMNPVYTGINSWTDYNLQNRIITIE
jgi:hypothetical protein